MQRIPFERALDLANKDAITGMLYPLFVHDIGALLYHPNNQRGSVGTRHATAALDRLRYIKAPVASQAPPSHQHHMLSSPSISAQALQSLDSNATLSQKHPPTPLTSRSSIIGLGNGSSSYQRGSIDISNAKENQSSANVGSKNSGKAEQHHNETGRSSLEHAKPDDDLKPSVPTEKVQKVELDGTLVYVTARTEIVNRLMDTFYELFGETMQESCGSESEDSGSEGCSSSAATSSKDVDAPLRTLTEEIEIPAGRISSEPTLRAISSPDSTYRGFERPQVEIERISMNQRGGNGKAPARKNNPVRGVCAQSSLIKSRTVAGKRRKDSSDADHSDEEDRDDRRKQPRRSSKKNPELLNSLNRFACPFVKRRPQRPPKCAACVYPGFGTTHRVKEHLYRNHIRQRKIRCPRCYESFDDDSLLRAHVTATERCPEGEEPPQDEELSQEQERSLRSKRRLGREGSEEVRWRQIFQICFPEVLEVDISSPCK